MGSLLISIKEAKDLPRMDSQGLTDATVKLYLLPKHSSTSKKKTTVVKNSLDPVWNEEFAYKSVSLKELKTERVLEVTVWDYDRRGSNDFIGGLRLGPNSEDSDKNIDWMDSTREEVDHWEEMLSHPGEWIEYWHNLRPSMQYLKDGYGIKGSAGFLTPVQETSFESAQPNSKPCANEGMKLNDDITSPNLPAAAIVKEQSSISIEEAALIGEEAQIASTVEETVTSKIEEEAQAKSSTEQEVPPSASVENEGEKPVKNEEVLPEPIALAAIPDIVIEEQDPFTLKEVNT